MKNVAILVVHYDSIAQRYETDMTYPCTMKEYNKDLYISISPKVETVLARVAVGSEAIQELEDLVKEYHKKNEEKSKNDGSDS